jgi:ligand-binding sensor domain-containing protein
MDNNGNVIVATGYGSRAWIAWLFDEVSWTELNSGTIRNPTKVASDSTGALWFATLDGIMRYKNDEIR